MSLFTCIFWNLLISAVNKWNERQRELAAEGNKRRSTTGTDQQWRSSALLTVVSRSFCEYLRRVSSPLICDRTVLSSLSLRCFFMASFLSSISFSLRAFSWFSIFSSQRRALARRSLKTDHTHGPLRLCYLTLHTREKLSWIVLVTSGVNRHKIQDSWVIQKSATFPLKLHENERNWHFPSPL